MTFDPTNVGGANIVERVKNILLTPQAEWDKIATEPADVPKLYTGYVMPLAALAAICGFIGMSVFGTTLLGVTYRVGIVPGVVGAILQVIMGLVGVYVMAIITNALAPNFGSVQDQGQAHKLAAYGCTAGFLAGVFTLFPPLAILGLLGLYSLALIYIGLPRLMKTPEDKRIGYFLTIIVVMILANIVIGVVVGSVRTAMGGGVGTPAYTFGQNAASEGELALASGGAVDLGALQRHAETMQAGGGIDTVVAPARLQEQLPQSLPGGFALTSASSTSAVGAVRAEGVYQSGDARLTISIVQIGDIAALTSLATAINVQESRHAEGGYARVQTIDGRVYSEEVSTSGGPTRYGVVGHGVAVTADGSSGVTLDQTRAAIETIGVQRLERQFGTR